MEKLHGNICFYRLRTIITTATITTITITATTTTTTTITKNKIRHNINMF